MKQLNRWLGRFSLSFSFGIVLFSRGIIFVKKMRNSKSLKQMWHVFVACFTFNISSFVRSILALFLPCFFVSLSLSFASLLLRKCFRRICRMLSAQILLMRRIVLMSSSTCTENLSVAFPALPLLFHVSEQTKRSFLSHERFPLLMSFHEFNC